MNSKFGTGSDFYNKSPSDSKFESDAVRRTLKSLYEVVQSQTDHIGLLERQISSLRKDFISQLQTKANITDISQTLGDLSLQLDRRITLEELQQVKSEIIKFNQKHSDDVVKGIKNDFLKQNNQVMSQLQNDRQQIIEEIENQVTLNRKEKQEIESTLSKRLESINSELQNQIHQLQIQLDHFQINHDRDRDAQRNRERDNINETRENLEQIRSSLETQMNQLQIQKDSISYMDKSYKDKLDNLIDEVNMELTRKCNIEDLKRLQLDQAVLAEFSEKLSQEFQQIQDEIKREVELVRSENSRYNRELLNQMASDRQKIIDGLDQQQSAKQKQNIDLEIHLAKKYNEIKDELYDQLKQIQEEIQNINYTKQKDQQTLNQIQNDIRVSGEQMKRQIEQLSKSSVDQREQGSLSVHIVQRLQDDVRGQLQDMVKELQRKASFDQLRQMQLDQAMINESLCSENITGRWNYKSGPLAPGSLVPWNTQVVNTLPDNFLWEKDKSTILVVSPGLYEITLGFYARKKPKIDVLINGEAILGAISSSSYVVHHSSGRLKDQNKSNITGLTLIDFILVPARARVSIGYTGDLGEGFLGLRRL